MNSTKNLTLMPGQVDIRVVSTSIKYRVLAKELPKKSDAVMEIGCSTGKATHVLAKSAGSVLAVDIDVAIVNTLKETMQSFEHVKVTRVDGRLGAALMEQMPAPDIIFIDVGGNAQMDNAVSVLRQCLRTFTPRIIVVRNIELAAVCSFISSIETPDNWHMRQVDVQESLGVALSSLLELSHSPQQENRLLAVRKLRHLDQPQARQRLQEMLSDPYERIRRVAALKPPDSGKTLP